MSDRKSNDSAGSRTSTEADRDVAPAESGSAAESTSDVTVSLEEQVAALEAERDTANDRTLRAQAELDNYRKRALREMEDERRYAALPLIRDLLPVVDNLELAINAAEQNESNAGLLTGVKMVASQLSSVMQQHHCQRIDAVGSTFDPHLHEAIGHEPAADLPQHAVTRETRAGYRLHDRVIRPAQVFIAAPPADEKK